MQFLLQLSMQLLLLRDVNYSEECLIGKNTLAKCNEDEYLSILHLLRVELRCKLQERSHSGNIAFNTIDKY